MLKLSLFLSLSFLGTLKAQASNQAYVDYPQSCLSEKKYPCTLKTAGTALQMEISGSRYLVDQESSIQFHAAGLVQLLKGKAFFHFPERAEIRLNPHLLVGAVGEVFIEKASDGSMKLKNLNAQIDFKSAYVFASEALPTGFENWYGPLAGNGQILRGVIKPIDKESFMTAWMPMSSLSVAEMRKKMKEYLDLWSGAVEQSAQFYQDVAQRRLASQQAKLDQAAQKLRKKDEEKDQLRRLYREKNGL